MPHFTIMRDMENAKQFAEQLFASLKNVLPESLADDAKANIKATLSSALQELDLVSREELDVQNQVLSQTRQQLRELEIMVKELEQHLSDKP